MATYSPELLAALRQRYEDTDQPMNALAAEFEIGITTLQTLVRKNGWTQRSKRMRDCPPALRLVEEAQAPVAPEPETPVLQAAPTLSAETSEAAAGATALPPPLAAAEDDADTSPPPLSPLERIEALIVKELAAEEAARAALGTRPRPRYDAERCARTLWVLTQTIERVQRLRSQADSEAAKAQEQEQIDIDEFREVLARRIMAFVEERKAREAEQDADGGSPVPADEP